jgi:hypothetical protein
LRTESPIEKGNTVRSSTISSSTVSRTGISLQDEVATDADFDEISKQIHQLYKPIQLLRSAFFNSLSLFKMALGLTQEATMYTCFETLKSLVYDSSCIELISSGNSPHKLSVSEAYWVQLPTNVQDAIKHFNALLSSSNRFIGSRELKAVDIQLKLEDIQLLPLTEEKARDLQKLRSILTEIDKFTQDVETLFNDVTIANKVFEHQINIY